MKKKTLTITDSNELFLKRKVRELRRMLPPGDEDQATESRVIQGLLSFWAALDVARQDPDENPA